MVRDRAPHGVDGEVHEIVVFATGATIESAPESAPEDGPPVGEQLRRAATAVHVGLEHARQFHARAGPRIGTTATVAPVRHGTSWEVIRPVLVDPRRAWEVAVAGQLFVEPIPGLRIERGGEPPAARYPVWSATVRTGWVRRRVAKLHVSASPSFNLTVLELIPVTPRRLGGRSFLRVGIPAVEELARRLAGARRDPLAGPVGAPQHGR